MSERKSQFSTCCVTGFCLTILSILVTCIFFITWDYKSLLFYILIALAAAIAGLVFSILGVRSCKQKNTEGKRLGTTGIVLSILILHVLLFICVLALFAGHHRATPPKALSPALAGAGRALPISLKEKCVSDK